MHDLRIVLLTPGIMQLSYAPLMPFHPFNAKVGLHCLMQTKVWLHVDLISQIALAACHFSSLNCTQLLSPTRSRLRFLDGTQLVGSVARHADVVVALENELEVAKFEG